MSTKDDGIRLSKVAREFNCSIDSIVEILNKNGLKVDRNPNTKIDLSWYKTIAGIVNNTESHLLSHKETNQILTTPRSNNTTINNIDIDVLKMIEKGESKTIEFKQTFNKNVSTNTKDKEIQKSTMKNIVAFLNTDGGNLLIGIHDNGEIIGIQDDFYISDDKYLLNFNNIIKSKIGAEFFSFIDWQIVNVQNKKILHISCKQSNYPCFYDEQEFYIRSNPSTEQLVGRKQHEYIKRRFK